MKIMDEDTQGYVLAALAGVVVALMLYKLRPLYLNIEAKSTETIQNDILKEMCHDTDKYDAWLAKDGSEWICFRQSHATKKISKSLIVLPE